MDRRYACPGCTRTDLSLTANGRVRSHAANGKRPGPDNPVCYGSGVLNPGLSQAAAPVTASGGPNPYRAPLPTGNLPHDRTTDQTEKAWAPLTPPTQDATTDPDRSSPPASTASAPPAADPSTKAAPSAGTATTTPTRSALMTEAPAADAFESAAPVRERADQKVERDSYGRYRLHHPVTGKKQAWQRATTFAKMLQDQYGLMEWQQRMTAKGLAMRPDLLDLVATLDVKNDRAQINKLLEEAKSVAGSKAAANRGTVVHKHTEDVDFGMPLAEVPARYQADVAAYREAMGRARLTTHPQLIERVTAVPDLDVAGTLDRIVQDRYGKYRTLDVKTGNMDFGQLEIAIQLAVYTHGVNTAGMYDLDTGTWQSPGFRVETDYALVAHIPFGKGTCDILRVPIDLGWEAVQTAAQVRDWRKQKKLFTAYEPDSAPAGPTPAPVRPPTWEVRAYAVLSQAEASALWKEALKELGQGPRLDKVVGIMKSALSG